jgi:2-succinyl-5-enolpyruvyl-6-hydroxy-3-cyclohexene-1-carboxylate synthase
VRLEAIHHRYVGAFVDELARAGVRHVCFAPGSRSTPLAVMLAQHPDITLWTHLDERSASFFALGMAKASREPVGILCSSGTAAANFYPAVIEARYSRVPLLVMTADRPPELQDVGAPQTIDQNRIYGEHAKWFANVALPDASPGMLRYVRTVAGRAVATARAEPRGPVHLNFPFREPLMPLPPLNGELLDEIDAGRPFGAPYVDSRQGPRSLDRSTLDALASEIGSRRRGIIVCGPQDDPALGPAVTRLARRLGFPVLADPLSLVRCGPHHADPIVGSYDAFLRNPTMIEALQPELVIRFGAMPTSKPYLLYSQRHAGAYQILVDGDGWNDPALLSARVLHVDPVAFCDGLDDWFAGSDYIADPDWVADWIGVDRATRAALAEGLAAMDELFEGRVFSELARLLPAGGALFAGNSMPVRDLDTFYPGGPESARFLSNRGANGIDGVVSSALGASVVLDGPLVLVIGDLSFYHDMNGLLAAKLHDLNATIVLVNNDGGGIFSFLPQAAHPEHFEALFGTPHGLDFRPVSDLYGLGYERVEHWDGFRSAVSESLASSGVQVIEVPAPDRSRNVALHRDLWRQVNDALAELELRCLSTP